MRHPIWGGRDAFAYMIRKATLWQNSGVILHRQLMPLQYNDCEQVLLIKNNLDVELVVTIAKIKVNAL